LSGSNEGILAAEYESLSEIQKKIHEAKAAHQRALEKVQAAKARINLPHADRFLEIAEAIKAEAGVTDHRIRASLSGVAWPQWDGDIRFDNHIAAPEGRTRKQLHILAHECGHIALKHHPKCGLKKHVIELQACQWAAEALRRHGVPVPRDMVKNDKRYVKRKIRQAGPKAKIVEAAAHFANV
jgi:hypothetical protein